MFSNVMSQKTITSFFSKSNLSAATKPTAQNATVKKEKKSTKADVSDNEVEKAKSHRKRVRIISSEDESDTDSNRKETRTKKISKRSGQSSSSEEETGKTAKESKSKQKTTSADEQTSSPETVAPKKKLRTYGKKTQKSSPIFDDHENTSDKIDPVSSSEDEEKVSPKKKAGAIDGFFNKKPKASESSTKAVVSSKNNAEGKKTVVSSKNNAEEKKTVVSSKKNAEEKRSTSPSKNAAVTPETYDPSVAKYHPIDGACWKHKENVPYMALAKTLEHIESTSARLKMIEILSNFLRSVIVLTPEDLLFCIYLSLNKLAPAYEGMELGVGDLVLMKAVAQATGRSMEALKSDVAAKGDLGIVAEACRSNQRTMFTPAKLSVKTVFHKLREIAQMTGHSVMTKKAEKIQSMFVACRGSEARYLIRSLSGKLRIGLAEQSLLSAVAQAATLTPPGQEYPFEIIDASKGVSSDSMKKKLDESVLILKTTYCECPSYDMIVPIILTKGILELPTLCKITPGIPIKPMLAHPTKGVQEVFQRFENARFTSEYKYDGERAQIHLLEDGQIHVYSRNQENNTTKYPDIISRLRNAMTTDVKSCILDAEAVAWDRTNKQILPFQILSTRKRKDANEAEIKVQVCVFAFDLLYLNGRSLVGEPYEERRKQLKEHFQEVVDEFTFATSKDSNNVDDIAEFLDEAIKNKCEGLMVKTLDVDATYEIAKRSHNWLKLKKDYLDGVGDTLDLVVIGGYYGKGKRAGNFGGFLLACYSPDDEEFQSICKIGTGFSDDDLSQSSVFLRQHVIDGPKSYYQFDTFHKPDVWFDAVQVWEVKCADLSISPAHKAAVGIVDPTKGISLRFPRFLRIRDDKKPEDATTAEQVAQLYNSQELVKNQTKTTNKDEEEDFY